MNKSLLNSSIAILSGCILTLSFAPFRIDIFAIVALSIFFFLLNKCSRIRDAFFTSALFGFGFFGTSISWVYISIHLFTESVAAGFSAAIALVILLSFLHIIPFGTFSYILTRKASSKVPKLLIYPALWTLFEIVKANLLWGGFPWVSLGYSQTESLLVWYSSIGGVYLVTYIIAFIACLIAFYLFSKNLKAIIISVVIIIVIYLIGHIIYLNHPQVKTNQSQKVVLVQGDFIQGFKWDRANFTKMEKYYENIDKKYKNSLIIFSENAIPAYRQYLSPYFNELTKIANKNNNAILLGSLSIVQNGNSSKVYNSSIIIGKGHGIYNKHHLVPFGEYFPIKFFGYVDSAGLSNFNAGDKIQPIMYAFGSPLANFICYEVGYPEQVRDQLQGARVISVISDDSWFGDSIARYQQLQISQVRAIENAKFVLTTTSNGITSIINSDGVIEKELPKDTRAVLQKNIYLNNYQTVWTHIGMSLIWLIIIFSLIAGIIIKETKKSTI